jgi:Family of unknown function (DUF6159)
MNISTRLSNGWTIAQNSFSVLKENRQLILFPILSAISMILVIGSFAIVIMGAAGWDTQVIEEQSRVVNYLIVFGYYGAILSWSIFAATVGTLLRILQDSLGRIGKIITSLIGIVWSVATFFVVPIIAYENLGPLAAFKRSSDLVREKWGEGLGATFSFGLIQIVAFLLLAIPCFLLGYLIHPLAGIILFIPGAFMIIVVLNAAKVVFVSAIYHNINGDPVKHYNQQLADSLFMEK